MKMVRALTKRLKGLPPEKSIQYVVLDEEGKIITMAMKSNDALHMMELNNLLAKMADKSQ